jgi:CBS domain-containing protein
MEEGYAMSILVRHAMTERPHTIESDMNAADAASIMKTEDVGALPVTENGELAGVVTDRDLVLRVVAERQNPMDVRVGDIATRSTVTVTPDTKLSDAREVMQQHKIRRLPVTKGGEIVGILSLGDVAWADASTREVGEALRDISESEETRSKNDDAERGTPRRVAENRRTG